MCFCYLIVACGITINMHYCGGKLQSTSLLKISEEGCCGEEAEDSGCCDNEVAIYKLKDDHQTSAF